jgi:hypothetical protein
VNVENTGTVENTYELEYEGPEWISIKPEELTVSPGQTKEAYMYAGIPFKKEGNVQITATATGNNAQDTQTVELVIGDEVEQAIQENENKISGNGITGQFSKTLGNLSTGGTAVQVAAAVLAALLITGVILIREW